MTHAKHRQRIRERFFREGLDSWDSYLQLELLLSFGHARKDTKPIAKELLKRFGNLAGVMDASPKELQEIEGVGEVMASVIKITRDMGRAYINAAALERDLINHPELAIDALRADLAGASHEQIRALFLNSANKLIANELLFEGTIDQAPLYPRQIVKRCIELDANAIILAHNHPGGSLVASPEDKKITREIQDALNTIDIRLLDHLIISRSGWLSFQQEGLL